MYNRVILMGRLTKDPELRTTQGGSTYCRFSIAVDRKFVKQGEERQADFFDITCWGQQAEFVCKYFHKGRPIHVEGRLQNNNYTDQNGNKRYSNDIVAESISFCGDKREGGGQPYGGNQSYGGGQSYGGNQSYGGGQPYQQSAPAPQAAPPPQAAVNRAPQPIELGDLGDFEEILSDGEVPF